MKESSQDEPVNYQNWQVRIKYTEKGILRLIVQYILQRIYESISKIVQAILALLFFH